MGIHGSSTRVVRSCYASITNLNSTFLWTLLRKLWISGMLFPYESLSLQKQSVSKRIQKTKFNNLFELISYMIVQSNSFGCSTSNTTMLSKTFYSFKLNCLLIVLTTVLSTVCLLILPLLELRANEASWSDAFRYHRLGWIGFSRGCINRSEARVIFCVLTHINHGLADLITVVNLKLISRDEMSCCEPNRLIEYHHSCHCTVDGFSSAKMSGGASIKEEFHVHDKSRTEERFAVCSAAFAEFFTEKQASWRFF